MLCDLCHKNTATVHLTEIVNGKVVELHICQECLHLKSDELKRYTSVTESLGSLTSAEHKKDSISYMRCPFCGIGFNDFKKKGFLGCAHCYNAFRRQLFPIIEKVHGSLRHNGKIPASVSKGVMLDRELIILKKRLEKAVQIEAYEDAAGIRDKIKEVKDKLTQK